ncbi:MAG: FHA domain-containing protein [Chloroflexi bacterium]|nr:FHA domain-containing protein [Chloroflexota bacterium]
MDWNLILFITKWATIGLFYAVLLLLLFGVYREMSQNPHKVTPVKPVPNGRLRVISAGDDGHLRQGSVLDISADNRLGADKDNDILLRDSYVSRRHARLRWDRANWWVEDLNSKNGTMVDRHRCTPGVPYPLTVGSILSIGDMSFELIDQDTGYADGASKTGCLTTGGRHSPDLDWVLCPGRLFFG